MALVAVLLLAACGGAGGTTPVPAIKLTPAPHLTPTVPAAVPLASPIAGSPTASPEASPFAASPAASPAGANASPAASPAVLTCGATGGTQVSGAAAKPFAPDGAGIVVVAALNVRSGPGTDCPRVGSMGFGTSVTLDGPLIKRDGFIWRHLSGPEGAGFAVADAFQAMPAQQPTQVPILMYHHVANPPSRYTVTPAELDEQMAWLKKNGYVSITPTDLYNALYRHLPLPAKPVMITNDDGNPSTMLFEQILTKYGFRGVYFLPNVSYVTQDQIVELANSGEACGHTVTHPDLSQLSDEQQEHEIADNKAWLENIIGQPVICFAYPFGTYNDDTAQIIADAGYQLAFNAWGSPASLTDPDRWHIPRVEIDGGISMDQFVNAVHNGG